MIEFKEGAVCYANGVELHCNKEVHKEYPLSTVMKSNSNATWAKLSGAMSCHDFQLNEPKEGYYIPKSELDTEEKYNQAVEVFGLLGFSFSIKAVKSYPFNKEGRYLSCCDDGLWQVTEGYLSLKVKLTFDQLMAIGELKRKMNESDSDRYRKYEGETVSAKVINSLNTISAGNIDLPKELTQLKRNKPKAKEAYRILESMGVEWDNVKGKWFKVSKEWL